MSEIAFQELEQLFQEALGCKPETLDRFLSRRCAGRPDLESQVRQLLEIHHSAGRALPTPGPSQIPVSPTLEPGFAVGNCTILRPIGQGGMGTVYEAEQSHPKRRVALKLLAFGFSSNEWLPRFDAEVEALARLQHPGVARIYEAGTIDLGHRLQPYFVMELVEGETLRRYAQLNPLSYRTRMSLLSEICDAIHHAHQRGVIHRDLKPENILIDESGRPHVVDFGIAKLIDDSTDASRVLTRTAEQLFTMAYAAPEQITKRFGPTDVRTDVYALGIIAFELLSGSRPYSTDGALEDSIRAVTEKPPELERLTQASVYDDTCSVVAKALAKQPSERYDSAAALRDDLIRARDERPVEARSHSRLYLLRKLLGQYRTVAILTAIVAAVVIGIGSVAVVGWSRAERFAQSSLEQMQHERLDQVRLLSRDGQTREAHRLAWSELARYVASLPGARDRSTATIERERDLRWALRSAYRHSPSIGSFRFPVDGRLYEVAEGPTPDSLWLGDEWGHVWRFELPTQSWQRHAQVLDGALTDIVGGKAGAVAVGCAVDGQCSMSGWANVDTTLQFRHQFESPAQIVRLVEQGAVVWALNGDEVVAVDRSNWTLTQYRLPRKLRGLDSFVAGPTPGVMFLLYSDRLVRRNMHSGSETEWKLIARETNSLAFDERRQRLYVATDGGSICWLPVSAEADDPCTTLVTHMLIRRFYPKTIGDQLVAQLLPNGLISLDLSSGEQIITWGVHGFSLHDMFAWDNPALLVTVGSDSAADHRFTVGFREVRHRPQFNAAPTHPYWTWHSISFDDAGNAFVAGTTESNAGVTERFEIATLDFTGQELAPIDTPQTVLAQLHWLRSSGNVLSVGHDGRLLEWVEGTPQTRLQLNDKLFALDVSPDEKLAAVGGMPSEVVVLALDSGVQWRLQKPDRLMIKALAFDPTGNYLLGCGRAGATVLWELQSKRSIYLDLPRDIPQRAAAWSPDGRRIAIGNDHGTIHLLDGTQRKLLHSIHAHAGTIYALDFSPVDSTLLASGSTTGVVSLWDAGNGRELARLIEFSGTRIFDLQFSPDGRRLLVGGDRSLLGMIDLEYFDRHIEGDTSYQLGELGVSAELARKAKQWIATW